MKQAFEATHLEPPRLRAYHRLDGCSRDANRTHHNRADVQRGTVLDRLFERLRKVMERLGLSYQIVVVNDGSTDETLAGLLEHRARNPALKV